MNTPEPDSSQAASPAAGKPAEPAVHVIRAKIAQLYKNEPDAQEEVLDAAEAGKHRSRHQDFMYKLSTSGKSLAEIQTEWHNYYVHLPDTEKHEVWQEFYAEHSRSAHRAQPAATHHAPPHQRTEQPAAKPRKAETTPRTIADIKSHLLAKVGTRGKLPKNQHFKALLFGLSMGSLVILVLLFSFFNERFIAPFITPSKSVSNTSIIIDPNSTTAGPNPQIIIPKINVEIPVVYDQPSTEEKAIQQSLQNGVVHYATTPSPGQQGNVVIVGHSSNNIFNQGKYKFAFVLLNRLENGDTFSLTKDGKRYVYRIYDKKIVTPTDVSVLGATDKPGTATLITCDPPGTSLRRLIVIGEQITPDPSGNGESTASKTDKTPSIVPGNATSLWQRFKNWITS
jgi:sortase A